MRCALVTGVQTCALLISFARAARWRSAADDGRRGCRRADGDAAAAVQAGNRGMNVRHNESMSSAERRVGIECVSTCRTRWSQVHVIKTTCRYRLDIFVRDVPYRLDGNHTTSTSYQ